MQFEVFNNNSCILPVGSGGKKNYRTNKLLHTFEKNYNNEKSNTFRDTDCN